MPDQKTQAEIDKLKRKARTAYIAYLDAIATVGDAGSYLSDYLCIDASQHKFEFNALMDKLSHLDPTCPTVRI